MTIWEFLERELARRGLVLEPSDNFELLEPDQNEPSQ